MAVPKLEVLVHAKVSITGPTQTATIDIQPPTADEKWTLKHLHVFYTLDANISVGGAISSYKMEIIDQAAVVDNIQLDSDSQNGGGTKTVQKLYAAISNTIIIAEPFPVVNITVENPSFIRLTIDHDTQINAAEVSILNAFVTGLKRFV